MLNVQELERQWLRYKLKSYLPKLLLSSAILIVIIIVIVIFFKDDATVSGLTHEIAPIETTQHKSPKIIDQEQKQQTLNHVSSLSPSNHNVKESTHTQNETPSQLTLTPSLNFVNTLKEMPKETISKPLVQPVKTKEVKVVVEDHKYIPAITQPNKSKALQSDRVEHVTKEKEDISIKKPPSQFSINIKEEEADIQDVITRFENNKNPALSLFVAKRYYAIKNYDDAYNYALLTNDINPDIEESWLIAAKSLDKLGKKKASIRLLTEFINKSHSIRGTMILEQIKNGTLQ